MSIDKSKAIKVICDDHMCFQVNAESLEALCCGYYDPWASSFPEHGYKETISYGEWLRRLDEKRLQEHREYIMQKHYDTFQKLAK